MKTLLLASVLFAGLFGSMLAAPAAVLAPVPIPTTHAYCRTIWLFATPCAEIGIKITKQIQAFDRAMGCADCGYTLVSSTPMAIKANHTSVDGLQAETIAFSLSPTVLPGGCRVTGQSVSLGFTSLLDNGLNYCNLYKLLSASGLTADPGFMEITNDWACLGYGLATCKETYY